MLILKKAWLSNDIYPDITIPRVLLYLAYLNYERRKQGFGGKKGNPWRAGVHLIFTHPSEMLGKLPPIR